MTSINSSKNLKLNLQIASWHTFPSNSGSSQPMQKVVLLDLCNNTNLQLSTPRSIPSRSACCKVLLTTFATSKFKPMRGISINWSKNASDWSINSRPDPPLSSPCPQLVLRRPHCDQAGEGAVFIYYLTFASSIGFSNSEKNKTLIVYKNNRMTRMHASKIYSNFFATPPHQFSCSISPF